MATFRFHLGLMAVFFLLPPTYADEMRGRIARIDADKKEIQLEGVGPFRGSMLDLKVSRKTQILIGGQPATLNDLTPGRRVRVVYEQRDGTATAQVIRSFGLGLPQPQSAPPAIAAPKEGEGVVGTLQRIGLTDREIVVIGPGTKGPRTETTLAVPEEAVITNGSKKIALEDLKEGDAVTVAIKKVEDKLTATSIRIGEVAAGAKPVAPPRRDLIPRLRQALKMADELLREMEDRNAPPPDRP